MDDFRLSVYKVYLVYLTHPVVLYRNVRNFASSWPLYGNVKGWFSIILRLFCVTFLRRELRHFRHSMLSMSVYRGTLCASAIAVVFRPFFKLCKRFSHGLKMYMLLCNMYRCYQN